MVLVSAATLRQLKREKLEIEDLEKDPLLHKRLVDSAFERLKKKLLIDPKADSTSNQILREPSKPKKKRNKDFVGRVVALLTTGETGIIIEKPNRKCMVRLDKDSSVIKTCVDSIYWLRYCSDQDDAVAKIYQAVCYVPQISDLKLGDRVAIVKLKYQTGTVESLPVSKKQCCFIVRLEVTQAEYRCKAEGLRLIDPDYPAIGPPFGKVGRPTREEVREKRKQPLPLLLIPKSKSTVQWKAALRPPKVLPPPKSDDSSSSEEEEEDEDEFEDDLNVSDEENAVPNELDAEKQTEFLL